MWAYPPDHRDCAACFPQTPHVPVSFRNPPETVIRVGRALAPLPQGKGERAGEHSTPYAVTLLLGLVRLAAIWARGPRALRHSFSQWTTKLSPCLHLSMTPARHWQGFFQPCQPHPCPGPFWVTAGLPLLVFPRALVGLFGPALAASQPVLSPDPSRQRSSLSAPARPAGLGEVT